MDRAVRMCSNARLRRTRPGASTPGIAGGIASWPLRFMRGPPAAGRRIGTRGSRHPTAWTSPCASGAIRRAGRSCSCTVSRNRTCRSCRSSQARSRSVSGSSLTTCAGTASRRSPSILAFYRESHRWADESQAVIDGTALAKPVLVGWSLGGRVLRQYLMHYGDAADRRTPLRLVAAVRRSVGHRARIASQHRGRPGYACQAHRRARRLPARVLPPPAVRATSSP